MTEAEIKRLAELAAKADRTEAETKEMGELAAKAANDTEEIELDADALSAIVDQTKSALLPEIEAAIAKSVEDGNAAIQKSIDEVIAKAEKTIKKDIKQSDVKDAESMVTKGITEGTIDKEVAEMTPAMRFYVGMRALTGDVMDTKTLKKINAFNIASQADARKSLKKQDEIAKTGYANETTAADGAVLIPDAEFVTTLYDNLPNYGVAFSDADVRQTDRTSVRVISLDSGLAFYATAEGGVKTSAKLAFSKNEVTLAKYAVIVPATDELTDDAAIDYWNVVTRELTRAYAKLADEITFTNATSGITNQTGVITHTIGASLDWDDILTAQSKTEDDLDESNNKWYMRKETWFALVMKKGTSNDHYIAGSLNTATGWVANPNTPTTPWGTPVKFTRVLPTINSVSANDGFAVYGDLRNFLLYNKRGMQITIANQAQIVDADGATTNLFTQDISAMRGVVRLLGILPKGNRTKFVVLGTGTVS